MFQFFQCCVLFKLLVSTGVSPLKCVVRGQVTKLPNGFDGVASEVVQVYVGFGQTGSNFFPHYFAEISQQQYFFAGIASIDDSYPIKELSAFKKVPRLTTSCFFLPTLFFRCRFGLMEHFKLKSLQGRLSKLGTRNPRIGCCPAAHRVQLGRFFSFSPF